MTSEGQVAAPLLERQRRKSFEGGSSTNDSEEALTSAIFGRRDSFDSVVDVAPSLVARKRNENISPPGPETTFGRRRSRDRPEFALPELPSETRQTGGLCLTGSAENFNLMSPRPPASRKLATEANARKSGHKKDSTLQSLTAGPRNTLGRLGALSAGAAAQLLGTAAAANPFRHLPSFSGGTGTGGNATAAPPDDGIMSILPMEPDGDDQIVELTGGTKLPDIGETLAEHRGLQRSLAKSGSSPRSPTLPAPVLPGLEEGTEEMQSPKSRIRSLGQCNRQGGAEYARISSAASSSASSVTSLPADDASPSPRSEGNRKRGQSKEKGRRPWQKANLQLDDVEMAEAPGAHVQKPMSRKKSPRSSGVADSASPRQEGEMSTASPRRRRDAQEAGSSSARNAANVGSADSLDGASSSLSPGGASSPRRSSNTKKGRALSSMFGGRKSKERTGSKEAVMEPAGLADEVLEDDISDERLEVFMRDVFAEYCIQRDKQLRPLMTGASLRKFMGDFISHANACDVKVDADKAQRSADEQYSEEIERQVDMNFHYDLCKMDAKRGLSFKAFCCLLDQVLTRGTSRRLAKAWFIRFAGNAGAMHESIANGPSGLIA